MSMDPEEVYTYWKADKRGRTHLHAEDVRSRLPEGVEHGSAKAVILGCECKRCLARKKRMMKRGYRG